MACPQLSKTLYSVKEKSFSEEDLKETERLLKNWNKSQFKSDFQYRDWVKKREETIEKLGVLEKKLENLYLGCNAAHGVGSAMEVVGGLAAIAGVAFTLCGHKNIGEFLTKKVSTISTVTGTVTSVSSAVAKTGLTYKNIKEAKMVMEKDREYTEILRGNLQNSKLIDSHLIRIFNCSVLWNGFILAVQLVQEGILLLQIGCKEISKLMDKLKATASKYTDVSEVIEIAIQNVCTSMENLMSDREASRAVWNICEIIRDSPLALESIKLSLRITFKVSDILKMDVFSNLMGLGPKETSGYILATKGLLSTVKVAVSVLAVISAVRNAKDGTSEYSKMLKELKRALVIELNTVRKDYSKLVVSSSYSHFNI